MTNRTKRQIMIDKILDRKLKFEPTGTPFKTWSNSGAPEG